MIRIALVSYINTRPFIDGLNTVFEPGELELLLLPPAACAEALKAGRCDLALIPVGAVPDFQGVEIMKDYCIGADGKVDSVFLFSRQPVETLDQVILDRHSRTSNGLTRLFLKHFWKKEVEFVHANEKHFDQIQGTTGGVVIGDKALKIRHEFEYQYDLAECWKQWTGLPFTFAVWVYFPGAISAADLARITRAQRLGTGDLEATAEKWAAEYNMSVEVATKYLKESISYPFDAGKHEAMRRYLTLLERLQPITEAV